MNIAVIFAGGVGKRMQSKSLPKQFLLIHGKPIIIYTLEYFEHHKEIDAIVVSCVESWIEYFEGLLKNYNFSKIVKIVPGGETGQLSIYNGLVAAEEYVNENNDKSKSIVLVHDGVRPLITEQLISDNIKSVKSFGSGITSAAVKETLLTVDKNEFIESIPDRNMCRVAKAPQSFYLDELLSTHRKALEEGITSFIDSCSMMTHYGYTLHLINGPVQNIKITTADDFYSMRAILDAQENAQLYGFEHQAEE